MNNTLLRAVDILELFAATDKSLGVSELSRALGIPKSSVFDIVHTLCERDLLVQTDERLHLYQLGVGAFRIGSAYINRLDLCEVARPVLTRLRDEVRETIFMAVENRGKLVYVLKLQDDSPVPVRTSSEVGSINEMLRTGLGKALLAAYPEEKVRALVTPQMFEKSSDPTLRDHDSLLKHLREMSKQGYVEDNGLDNDHMLRCVAVPIYNAQNEAIAAVSVVSLFARMPLHRRRELGAKAVAAGLEISRKMGYMGTALLPAR